MSDTALLQPGTSDEYLARLLAAAEGGALGDIVRSIQAEQDRIIRAAPDTPVLVRGVAGSGKTSIAYHRLAYLLYPGNAPKLKASSSVVFAPNHLFIGYASPLMARLGISTIHQTTFEDWAQSVVGDRVHLAPAEGLSPERAERARVLRDSRMFTLAKRWSQEFPGRLLPRILSRPIPDGSVTFTYDRQPQRGLKLEVKLVGDQSLYSRTLESVFGQRPLYEAQGEFLKLMRESGVPCSRPAGS